MSELSLEMVLLRGRNFRPIPMPPVCTAPGGVGVVVSSTPNPESDDEVLRVSWDEQVDEADDTVDDDFAGGLRDTEEVVVAAGEETAAAAANGLLHCLAEDDFPSGRDSSLRKQWRSESSSWSAVSLSTKSSHV